MTSRKQSIILAQLLSNVRYAEAVLPFMESELFTQRSERAVFSGIKDYFNKYSACPTREELTVYLDREGGEDHEDRMEMLGALDTTQCVNDEWLMNETETFIKEQRFHNFVIDVIDKSEGGKQLPSAHEYERALDFTFTQSVGHDIFRDWQGLHQHMTDTNERFPFDIPQLNSMTNGGVTRKTLNVLLGPTSGGKSLTLCHLSAAYVRQGRNVLYLTLETSEVRIRQRILANLLDLPAEMLPELALDQFGERIAALRQRYTGNLKTEEYPALAASVTNFRALLVELKRTEKFVPDVVIVDYLNLCRAASLGKAAKADLYQTVGAIAAELRGLATERNIVVWTATQTNRHGYKAAEIELEHTSESYAVNSAADLILSVSFDDALPDKVILKLLKQRNDGISGSRKAVLGVDKSRMKIFDADPAGEVRKLIAARPPRRQRTLAAHVNGRKPSFGSDEDEVAEAV